MENKKVIRSRRTTRLNVASYVLAIIACLIFLPASILAMHATEHNLNDLFLIDGIIYLCLNFIVLSSGIIRAVSFIRDLKETSFNKENCYYYIINFLIFIAIIGYFIMFMVECVPNFLRRPSITKAFFRESSIHFFAMVGIICIERFQLKQNLTKNKTFVKQIINRWMLYLLVLSFIFVTTIDISFGIFVAFEFETKGMIITFQENVLNVLFVLSAAILIMQLVMLAVTSFENKKKYVILSSIITVLVFVVAMIIKKIGLEMPRSDKPTACIAPIVMATVLGATNITCLLLSIKKLNKNIQFN